MEEADGLVYCTFQNISTARLTRAVASLVQTRPQDSGEDPGWQARWSEGRSRREARVLFGEEKGKGGISATGWGKCLNSYLCPA